MSIPLYFLLNPIIAALGIVYTYKRAVSVGLRGRDVADISILTLTAGLIGARLFFVVFEAPFLFLDSLWDIFKFWEGGFVVFGGWISGAIFGVLACRIYSVPIAQMTIAALPAVSLSYALGRVVCFITGCCYGQFCELPWAIQGRHPTQLYAVLGEFLVYAMFLFFERSPALKKYLIPSWIIGHGFNRFVMEAFRSDPRWFAHGLSLSQWIVLIASLIAIIWIWWIHLSHKKSTI